jgi:hypothetical protein
MADVEIRVEGLRELSRTLGSVSKPAKKELRNTLRDVAKPVAQQAETLAAHNIRNVRPGDKWDVTRIGVTQKEVYIVPKQRGVKGRGQARHRRPMFGTLLMERAFDPALKHNQARILKEFDGMLDLLAERINRA